MGEIEHQALHDALTGLPNRTLYRDRVAQALLVGAREGGRPAVFLLDLDHFKEINDTLGHGSGDILLQEVGRRLRGLLRESDTVARLGGDEFAILAPNVETAAGALELAQRLVDGLAEPITVEALPLDVQASVGIALFPEHGEDVETLMRHADVAMYLSKESHGPVFYNAKSDQYPPSRLGLMSELRPAIEGGEMVLHYQPQVEPNAGDVLGVEALVRWQHPERGLLPPNDFVPLAEHTGLIRLLTGHVLETALRQLRSWQDEGLELRVAVNISGRDLLDLHLPDQITSLLERFDMPASRLELEITENTILIDPARASTILSRLSELGIRLTIDDYGTGHSSLGYLKRLPVNALKIDKSFVQNMTVDENDAAIVRTTIDLGHNLGLDVVAEGVETKVAWDCLAGFGCDAIQGFFLSGPVAPDELRSWLARSSRPNPSLGRT